MDLHSGRAGPRSLFGAYRSHADEPGFAMPIRVGRKGEWQTIRPTKDWRTMSTSLGKEGTGVDTDFYYVNVRKL